jgi:undecaprenyl diphosphate synthase
MTTSATPSVPNHVGFILDGNRRWARKHSLPELDGHMAGYTALKEVLRAAYDKGISYVTVYAFSNENWQRDGKEVSGLMRLVMYAITSDLKELMKNEVKVRFLGRTDGLSAKIVSSIRDAEAKTAHFTRGTLAICFNYGGQQEIVDATRQCIVDGLAAEDIDEAAINSRVYAPDVPPLDMIVRTSGEQRLSNFMLWRSSYAELYFIEKLWPEMTSEDVADIINEYNRRMRRFGA